MPRRHEESRSVQKAGVHRREHDAQECPRGTARVLPAPCVGLGDPLRAGQWEEIDISCCRAHGQRLNEKRIWAQEVEMCTQENCVLKSI